MRFHCVTAVASASAGGAADALRTPSAPTHAQTAAAMNQTERLRAILPPVVVPPSSYVCSKSLLGQIAKSLKGRRVVVGQRLMQAASDIFLGWFRAKGIDGESRDYYVRQLHDWKAGIDADALLGPGATPLCAALRSHARARTRALGRPYRDRLVPRRERRLRPFDLPLRGRVRRPERARLRDVRRGGPVGPAQRGNGPVARARGSRRSVPDRRADLSRYPTSDLNRSNARPMTMRSPPALIAPVGEFVGRVRRRSIRRR
jgi:uncharacterized protein DUF2252